ncbi:hypothetical protein B14911_22877 [Bacillus sp. NRRL B-14911]|nr:hypothetical protein B14911_22877 [Bacillus sp. NRRL B-14911]
MVFGDGMEAGHPLLIGLFKKAFFYS